MNFKEFLEASESFTEFIDSMYITSNCKGLTKDMMRLIMGSADNDHVFRDWGLDDEVPGKIQVLLNGNPNKKQVMDLLSELHKMLVITEIHSGITSPIDAIDDILYNGVEVFPLESFRITPYFSLWVDHDLSDKEYASLSSNVKAMDFGFEAIDREEGQDEGMGDDEIWIECERNIELEYLLDDFKQKLGAGKISLFFTIKLGGTCIRCGKGIELDVYKPFCKDDYSDWWRTRTRDKPKKETYCHKCGKEYGSSLNEPLCPGCKDKTGSYS